MIVGRAIMHREPKLNRDEIARWWFVDISICYDGAACKDFASGVWEPGKELKIEGKAIPPEVQNGLMGLRPLQGEAGLWDVQVGDTLYRVTYREAS
jgi:hypothetical protein